MGLNIRKLEKVRALENGVVQARCPACAEGGHDRSGEHLRIYPDGRFGCCVHPKDREHRKRIYALAGERNKPRGIQVRVATSSNVGSVKSGILGRLGRVFSTPAKVADSSDGSDGVNEVEPQVEEVRTPRTGESESNGETLELFRTPRTPPLLLTRIANETVEREKEVKEERELKEFRFPVRSVRSSEGEINPPKKERLPHFTPGGTLVIPFDSPERYHWWKGGQSVADTLKEVKERMNDASEF